MGRIADRIHNLEHEGIGVDVLIVREHNYHATQQAVLEAHELAFGYFGGVFRRLRYDNLKSAGKKILRGYQREETSRLPKTKDYVFPTSRLKGRKPLSASIMVQKYLRPAAIKAGVIRADERVRFGFHNFRHSLASALVKLKCDPKTVQGLLRHEEVRTTMQLYAQSDREAKLEAQGRFLELLGDRAHLLTERVQ